MNNLSPASPSTTRVTSTAKVLVFLATTFLVIFTTDLTSGDAYWVAIIVAVPASVIATIAYAILLFFRRISLPYVLGASLALFLISAFMIFSIISSGGAYSYRNGVLLYQDGDLTAGGVAFYSVPPLIYAVEFIVLVLFFRWLWARIERTRPSR